MAGCSAVVEMLAGWGRVDAAAQKY